MRKWIFAAGAAIGGIAVGWLARGQPAERIRVVTLPPKPVAPAPKAPAPEPEFPKMPKPSVETPVPVIEEAGAAPPPLVGDFPRLPAAEPGGMEGPLTPDISVKIPAADLNADEALARRIVLQTGGEIVSSSDAKDSMGKIGRALVAETDGAGREKLRAALRKALGDRAVLSDAGAVNGTSPAIRKAEETLEAKHKERDRARIDFLPEAPALRQIEDACLAQEKALDEMRQTATRLRLTILLRPVLGT